MENEKKIRSVGEGGLWRIDCQTCFSGSPAACTISAGAPRHLPVRCTFNTVMVSMIMNNNILLLFYHRACRMTCGTLQLYYMAHARHAFWVFFKFVPNNHKKVKFSKIKIRHNLVYTLNVFRSYLDIWSESIDGIKYYYTYL